MRRWIVAAAVVIAGVACKGKSPAAKHDAAVVEMDWFECESALRKAPAASETARVDTILAGCHVCGDWTPILQWSKPQTEGGPTRLAIEGAMLACKGYCDANAKQRFLGTLDNARGADVTTPWRWLGEMCKADVSAVPDPRYMSGPYFALDRVARAVAAHGGDPAKLLGKIEIALPAVTMTGIGPALPIFDAGGRVISAPRHHVSLIGDQIYAGELPRAHLDASGVHVESGPEPYPGHVITTDKLKAAWPGEPQPSVAILASRATPAQQLVTLISAGGEHVDWYLVVDTGGGPEGWILPSVIPVRLGASAKDVISVRPETTVEQFAAELAKQHAARVGVAVAK
ncbi:MAG: hypothetical protein JWO36_1543 [Myxococcales bacterium]|nr:hypothetical protein [Myxococcales bacterium]